MEGRSGEGRGTDTQSATRSFCGFSFNPEGSRKALTCLQAGSTFRRPLWWQWRGVEGPTLAAGSPGTGL